MLLGFWKILKWLIFVLSNYFFQILTRSANPLGKLMDFLQEDVDSMQRELETWRTENKQLQAQLRYFILKKFKWLILIIKSLKLCIDYLQSWRKFNSTINWTSKSSSVRTRVCSWRTIRSVSIIYIVPIGSKYLHLQYSKLLGFFAENERTHSEEFFIFLIRHNNETTKIGHNFRK